MSYCVGISTATLYPMLTEQALLALCKRKVECVEIFINTECELDKKYLKELKSMLKEYGVSVRALHPFTCELESMMLFTHYPRRFEDGLRFYKRFFDAASFLEADLFVLHGNNRFNVIPDEVYFERFERLSQEAEKFSVTMVQENVARCMSGKLGFLKKMKSELGDRAKFVLDTKQAVRAGENPLDFARELGNSICHVHISDHDTESDCKLVGTGQLGYEDFMSTLLSKGFDGSVVIELYHDGYKSLDELYDNYSYIKAVRDNMR